MKNTSCMDHGINTIDEMGLSSRAESQSLVDRTVLDNSPNTQLEESYSGRLIICLDVSGSMNDKCEPKVRKIQAAIHAVIESLGVVARSHSNHEVALVIFNGRPKVLCDFVNIESGYQQLINSVQSMRADGGTNIPRVLAAAQKMLQHKSGAEKNTLLLMTDGHGGDGTVVAEDIKRMGVIIKVIGFGAHPSDVNEAMLKRVASTTEAGCLYEFATDQKSLTVTAVDFTQVI